MSDNEPTIINGPRKLTVVKKYGNSTGGAYFLGFLGAFIYYLQLATTFSAGVMGFLKALVWPAMLAYHLFKFLKIA
ncbi:MAG TPA: hypothetical protein VLE93_01405 [Candidatus Saccharimonadales bacterium]|nr:hypothetical protein [Candidatus Saccharimonadales bacterium]